MAEACASLREIEVLIRARYPIIYIVSWEEQRVVDWVNRVAKKREKRVFEWSFSTGVVESGSIVTPQKSRTSTTKDPVNALDEVMGQVKPAIFVFKDLHPFLTRNNFAVIRKLKETAAHVKDRGPLVRALAGLKRLFGVGQ